MPFVSESEIRALEAHAREIRCLAVEMIHRRQAGHIGGSLSAADILAALYFRTLRLDPQRPAWPERDRFLLSKGHASSALYAALAKRGYFPLESLEAWGELECPLQGHPDRLKTPGVDMTTGMLGHGVAVGAGLALAARLAGRGYRVYTLLGDGECQAGVVWEGAMTAAKYRLANLTALIDHNDVQLDGPVHAIMPLHPLAERWRAWGWHVVEIDGHNIRQIVEALELATQVHDSPTAIVARTTKGKGVSFMENDARWHGLAPDDAQCRLALEELRHGR